MNQNDKNSKPEGFLFDQWSRYDATARAIRAIVPDGGTVLDVGCGKQMLLGSFLPNHQVTYLDPLLANIPGLANAQDGAPPTSNVIGTRLTADSVADQSFDVVVTVDALEHIPSDARQPFLEQIVRASRRGVVIAAPFSDIGDAKSTDDFVHEAYRAKHGSDYSWLWEHEEFGLPNFEATCNLLRELGLECTSFGNGHTPWLKKLLATHVLYLDLPDHTSVLREVGDRFAQDIMRFDHRTPSYREVIVAARGEAPVVSLPPVDETEAAAAWNQFRAWTNARLAHHVDALAKSTQAAQQNVREAHEASLRTALQTDGRQNALQAEVEKLNKQLRASRHHAQQANVAMRQSQQQIAALHRSASWRLTAPVRSIDRVALRVITPIRATVLTAANWCVRIIPKGLLWPLKSAFFTLLKPLLKNSREYVEFMEAKRWRDRPAPPPALIIAEPHDSLPDVLVFGVIDWQLRIQRPQHLALELARRGHRVLYLTPSFKQAKLPGYDLAQVAEDLPIYQAKLHTIQLASIYHSAPSGEVHDNLCNGLRQLLGDIAVHANLSLVDHPGWTEIAKIVPRSQLIYDCMDNHHGFQESGHGLLAAERQLLAASDAVIVTSTHIQEAISPQHRYVKMIRNACAPDHFLSAAKQSTPNKRPIIGYFGAIADWFDVLLVEQVASKMTDCDFLMVGGDTAKVQEQLAHLKNVSFTGEVDYEVLPDHVQRMDVLFIPFIINELTLATNPVKAYEALAAGKPVVATQMPELMDTDLAPFVRTCPSDAEMIPALRAALAESGDVDKQQQRIHYAKNQTWSHRIEELVAATDDIPQPKVAVIIITWNSVELSKRCVQSVLDDPLAPDIDVILVDNASTDETPQWLDEVEHEPRVRIIRNPDNRGFATACNQGLAAGAENDADILVILNNDIVVTPGWATTLHRHLRNDPSIGLIGPVTNNIGNEAKVDTAYETLEAMQPEQRRLTGLAAGKHFDIHVLAFFCVAMPRDVYASIGPLDEKFGTGFFEDDDYCQRVRQLGRRIVCAEDVFVHHELSASFGKMPSKEREELFERNKTYYESKWGPWQRHVYRPKGQDRNAAAS